MMESFWSTMQIELLDRKRWTTRVELSNAIFEFIEVFYNRRRRHSQFGDDHSAVDISSHPSAADGSGDSGEFTTTLMTIEAYRLVIIVGPEPGGARSSLVMRVARAAG